MFMPNLIRLRAPRHALSDKIDIAPPQESDRTDAVSGLSRQHEREPEASGELVRVCEQCAVLSRIDNRSSRIGLAWHWVLREWIRREQPFPASRQRRRS